MLSITFYRVKKECQHILILRLKVNIGMQVTLHFNACIFISMQPVPLLLLVPALPVVSLSELSPELLIINCHCHW